jgi:hypothetical protein
MISKGFLAPDSTKQGKSKDLSFAISIEKRLHTQRFELTKFLQRAGFRPKLPFEQERLCVLYS